ncbi:TetR/AcrR family transcriptional regulator [Jiangella asiatica]|uniref:TetR/AcrR family transcriptional regulator n=1 Tax=Jiangella asiatica TaxID=2530372 RepID=A0A4R5DFR5_9ACTN|nr:TetR/AcrR family transcriptional regulator [Jiangella asiatica]TDE10624.1 TetR/AcrR family transcriptional regulator [Jiangella asiatica]
MARPKEFDPDHVVDAAMDVFWAGGYAATSTQDLCAGTGLGRSSLYNTFTSKHELYEQALRRYGERTRADQAELLERSGPVRAIIRDFLLEAVDRQLADPSRRGCLALNAAVEIGGADAVVADLTRADFDAIVDTMRALIERGQRTGELAPGRDAEALARLVHGALTGIHVVGRVAQDRERLSDIVDALIDSL